MSELDETQAIDQVINRLAERFPSLDRELLAEVVDEELHQFDGGRVRDFVPVLVEKAAKKRLKKQAKADVEFEQRTARLPGDLLPDS